MDPSVHTSALISEYGPSSDAWWLLAASLFVAAMGAAAVLNVLAGDPPWVLLAGGGLLYGALRLYRRFRKARARRVQVRENGIIVYDADARIEMRWDKFAGLHFGRSQALGGKLFGQVQVAASMTSNEGVTVNLDNNTQNIIGLIAAVRAKAAPIVAERIHSQLSAGQDVDLMGLKLIPTGILHGGHLLLWRDFGAAEVTPDHLIIRERHSDKPWCVLSPETVRNADAVQILGPRYARANP